MRIAFCGIFALADALGTFDPDAVVSVWSPGWPVREIEGRRHLHLPMHDVEERSVRTSGRVVPDERHVGAFLELIGTGPERVLIQCTAGLSRSPAFAIVAAVKAAHDPATACAEVKRLVPHAQPNRLILDTASELAGVNIIGAALSAFTYTRTTHGRPDGDRAGLCELFGPERPA